MAFKAAVVMVKVSRGPASIVFCLFGRTQSIHEAITKQIATWHLLYLGNCVSVGAFPIHKIPIEASLVFRPQFLSCAIKHIEDLKCTVSFGSPR